MDVVSVKHVYCAPSKMVCLVPDRGVLVLYSCVCIDKEVIDVNRSLLLLKPFSVAGNKVVRLCHWY